MSVELVSIMAVMGRAGFGMSLPMIIFFAVLAVGFTLLLWFYLSVTKKNAVVGSSSADHATAHEEKSLIFR
jgi:uncharacterized membrane protein